MATTPENNDAPQLEVGAKSYILKGRIGTGGFSEVYLGEDTKTGKLYALKIMRNNDERTQKVRQYITTEITNTRKVKQENVAKIYGYDMNTEFSGDNCTAMVQEYAANGELFSYISEEKLGEELSRYIFLKVVRGVNALHEVGIAHRDLTLQNILLKKHFQPVIIDMQFSKRFSDEDGMNAVPMTTSLGTKNYMAPEVLFVNRPGFQGYDGAGYDSKCDMWSLGVILFVLVTGTQPYRELENDWWVTQIQEEKWHRFWQAHERNVQYSAKFKELIQQLLCWNKDERKTAEELLNDNEGWLFDAKMRSKDYKRQMKRRQSRLKTSQNAERESPVQSPPQPPNGTHRAQQMNYNPYWGPGTPVPPQFYRNHLGTPFCAQTPVFGHDLTFANYAYSPGPTNAYSPGNSPYGVFPTTQCSPQNYVPAYANGYSSPFMMGVHSPPGIATQHPQPAPEIIAEEERISNTRKEEITTMSRTNGS